MKVGDLVGSYRVTRRLGEGGMGVVFEAVHEVIGRHAAIKVLKPEWAQNAEVGTRFLNEARAVNLIKHPSIVDIYEFGKTAEGAAFMVMEFLEGQTLASRLAERSTSAPIPIPNVVRTGKQLAAALAIAHRHGVIHRDLKPDNIFIVPDSEVPGGERAKILDFGLAKLAPAADLGPARVRTRSDVGMGTPDYMAPEQCFNANQVDGRADVYSLGCVLFELLIGRLPFMGEAQEVMRQRIIKEAPNVAELAPEASPALAAIIQKMLIRDRAERPLMDEVLKVFEDLSARIDPLALSDSHPIRTPRLRRWPVLAAGAAAGLIGLAAVKQWSRLKLPQRPGETAASAPARGSDSGPTTAGLSLGGPVTRLSVLVPAAARVLAKEHAIASGTAAADPPPTDAAPEPAKPEPTPVAAAPPGSSPPAHSASAAETSATTSRPSFAAHTKNTGTSRRPTAKPKPVAPAAPQSTSSATQPPPEDKPLATPAGDKPPATPPLEPGSGAQGQKPRGLRNDRIPSLLDKLAPSRP